jgi:RsiW-degrading membrane proteinase PrsW (M82 family)
MNFLRLTQLGWRQLGGKMLVTQATPQEVENIRVAFVLVALGIGVFWRIAVRILLAIVIIAIGAGAVVLLQGMHW